MLAETMTMVTLGMVTLDGGDGGGGRDVLIK